MLCPPGFLRLIGLNASELLAPERLRMEQRMDLQYRERRAHGMTAEDSHCRPKNVGIPWFHLPISTAWGFAGQVVP